MKGMTNARAICRAAFAAASVLLCVPAAWAAGQQHSAARAPQHYSAPKPQASRPQYARPGPNRNQNNGRFAPQPNQFRAGRPAPINPGARPAYPGYNQARPTYPRYMQPGYAPPGHLGAWLNQHRNVPVQDQERMLRNDPTFNRLPQGDQQRLMRQLNRVDQMPEARRNRTLARAEALERLSPQERAQVSASVRAWRTLPPDRQGIMKNAFHDLSSVPPDQRQTVLNSARYQNQFSPEERGILSNMLRVEPYEPPR